jgi:hypothetical protein
LICLDIKISRKCKSSWNFTANYNDVSKNTRSSDKVNEYYGNQISIVFPHFDFDIGLTVFEVIEFHIDISSAI